MKKLANIFVLSAVLLCNASTYAMHSSVSDTYSQRDTLEMMDEVEIPPINDYSMFGFYGGVVFSRAMWNPPKTQSTIFQPLHYGIVYTKYGKMFGYMPYFGFQIGADFMRQGYKFKENKETGITPSIMGATQVVMDVVEIPFMAHMHIDFWKMKLMANIGFYGGYRLNIHRSGMYVIQPELIDDFSEYDNRYDYGLKGGAGFAFVFDPFEIHFNALYTYSMSSYFQPDYNSPYYYRFGYPSPITATVGIHYQLTRREGKTRRALKREARRAVIIEQNGLDEQNN